MIKDIILVDKNDQEIGSGEKMTVHEKGLLHRAFSIFVFNSNNEIMLQRRALDKYHSGGLWTNTCCSHPKPGESVLEAAHRRLQEEMGFDCELIQEFSFIYQTELGDLIEHECDHVIVGKYDKDPKINSLEACEWKWVNIAELNNEIKLNPEAFTFWLKVALPKLVEKLGLARKNESD